MRPVRKGRKSGREAISRVEKSTTKWYASRADPSSIRDLKQTDAAAERRRSHSNLHSIKE